MTAPRLAIASMLAASALASLCGAVALLDFDSRPGDRANPPSTWPSGSGIPRQGHGPQLVVFVHPRCSCTAVTLEELSLLPQVPTTVVFAQEGSSSSLEESKSWMLATQIAGADIRLDHGSVEAKRFRVVTSGTVLLYSERGKLLFEGGISASRGHRGPSLGLDRLTNALRSGEKIDATSPVFGCGLTRKRV